MLQAWDSGVLDPLHCCDRDWGEVGKRILELAVLGREALGPGQDRGCSGVWKMQCSGVFPVGRPSLIT